MNIHRGKSYSIALLGIVSACAAPGAEDEPQDFDVLADQAPFGQISIEAHAQPPEGGTASVSVSSFGSVACTGTVCFSALLSTPTFAASANAGWHFVRWEGCSAAGSNATVTLGAVAQDERCNAVFEADAAPPQPTPNPPTPEPTPTLPTPVPTPTDPGPAPYDPLVGHMFNSTWTPERRISEKYSVLPEHVRAGLGGSLGPVTACESVPGYWGDPCHFAQYEYGRIYTYGSGHTVEIHGAIYAAWVNDPREPHLNWSMLPRSDEIPNADGRGARSVAGEWWYWSPEGGAWGVHWWTAPYYEDAGEYQGYWGYPVGPNAYDDDEIHCPKSPTNARMAQQFEHGWSCGDWDRAWFIPHPKP